MDRNFSDADLRVDRDRERAIGRRGKFSIYQKLTLGFLVVIAVASLTALTVQAWQIGRIRETLEEVSLPVGQRGYSPETYAALRKEVTVASIKDQNKTKALNILRARLYDEEQRRIQAEHGAARRSQVGSGDRSEKIRTYNFPQTRVTDHRIGYTSHRLESILDGEIGEFIEALTKADQEEKLKELVTT